MERDESKMGLLNVGNLIDDFGGGRKYGGCRTSRSAGSIVFSTRVHKRRGSIEPINGFLYIGESLMLDARFQVGDRVELKIGLSDGLGQIQRIPGGRYKLCGSAKSKKRVQRTAVHFTIRLGMVKAGFPLVRRPTECDGITIDEEGIMFNWPDSDITYKELMSD